MLKVLNWPGKVTGLSGTFTDRPAKLTDCTVISPAQFVYLHVQSRTPYLGQARYINLFYYPTRWEL